MGKRKIQQVAKDEVSLTNISPSTATITEERKRCSWVKNSNQLYKDYHDNEWGKPCHDERVLFEMLNLEGAQAGLSWETILKKRESYRIAFDNWDADIIAGYTQKKVEELLQNPGIVRNRLKVQAVITNAKAYQVLRAEFGGLDNYLWSQVPGRSPIINRGDQRIVSSPLSDSISKDLKKRSFKFVGTTIIYAYLQAVGLVNDHDNDCDFRCES